MNHTTRAVLRKNKKNSAGLCPVSICITIARERIYNPTGVSVPESAWVNERVKTTYPDSTLLNAKITKALREAEQQLLTSQLSGEEVTTETIQKKKKKAVAEKTSFYDFAEGMIADMVRNKQDSTARRYKNDLPAIKAYAGEQLAITEIDYEWLKNFHRFCLTTPVSRRRNPEPILPNTIWGRFKFLRKVLLLAQQEGIIEECPLGKTRGGYPMPAFKETPQDYLTLAELDKMFKLLDEETLSHHDELVLSFFLVECTAGIRHSDWSSFSVETLVKNKALKVRTKKTGEPIYVPVTPGSRLERVLNRIKRKNLVYDYKEPAAANKKLKILATMAGIEKRITTHSGRRTCCTLLLELGFSRETVAEVAGVSMRIIDTYAKITRQKLTNEFSRLGGL